MKDTRSLCGSKVTYYCLVSSLCIDFWFRPYCYFLTTLVQPCNFNPIRFSRGRMRIDCSIWESSFKGCLQFRCRTSTSSFSAILNIYGLAHLRYYFILVNIKNMVINYITVAYEKSLLKYTESNLINGNK